MTGEGRIYTEFVGRAKCNFDKGDQFDLKVGQQIALDKATSKMIKSSNITFLRIIREMNKEINDLEDLLRKKLSTMQTKNERQSKTST
jgi:hypothetical protein